MEEEGSNAFRYMHFLNRCAEGRCLWYPTEFGTVGDVGFVRDGYFNKVPTRPRLISNWYSHICAAIQRLRGTRPSAISASQHRNNTRQSAQQYAYGMDGC